MPTQTTLPLKDIHLPVAIDWWPPAIGWWLLAGLILLLLVFLIWLYRKLTRKTAVKTAKKQLLTIQQDTQLDGVQQLTALSSLLRRVAISLYPRDEIASLTGEAWLQFLDKSMQGAAFTSGIGQALKDAHYQKTVPENLNMSELFRLCENWLNAQTKQAKKIKRK